MPSKTEIAEPAQAGAALTWRAAEALGHAHYLNRGGRVLVSPYDTSQYDFVVEENGEFTRVNVKIATWNTRSYLISRAQTSSKNPDKYLVWLPRHNKFIELPGDFLAKAPTRRIPLNISTRSIPPGAIPQ